MKILVVGSGGREHAIAWRLAQDDRVETVYVAPGNAGTALTKKLINVPESDIARLADFVKTKPSTLNMIVPEINLNSEDLEQHIAAVNRAMRTYLRRHVFSEVHDYIYTRRVLHNGKIRHGLIGVIDLEQYEFHPGSKTTVRATEGVMQNRIEPRLTVRDLAPLEVSHTMLLVDDRENTVFSFLEEELDQMQPLYSFDLMKDSGSISGYLVTPQQSERIDQALTALATMEQMEKKYGITDKGIFLYAVGDGNNSLATAKLHYDAL